MALISDHCPEIEVTLVDIDESKIASWNDYDLMNLPTYEPGPQEVVKKNRNLFLVERFLQDSNLRPTA